MSGNVHFHVLVSLFPAQWPWSPWAMAALNLGLIPVPLDFGVLLGSSLVPQSAALRTPFAAPCAYDSLHLHVHPSLKDGASHMLAA